ncbi:MAG TPA: hypothetical protein P5333_12320 [Caldilinea sp.]|nr:hypothetical protein [Caldilinea sp.]
MDPASGSQSNWLIFGLEFLVVVSLALNVAILVYAWRIRGQVAELRTTVTGMIERAISDLQGFENLSMHFTVKVDDNLPVRSMLPVRDTLQIALKANVPVRQTVTSDVMVNTPLLNAKVPISVVVPLEMQVPIDLKVPIEVNSDIPVRLDIPVTLDVPVEIDLAETELGSFIEQVRSGLAALKTLLDDPDLGI